MSFHFHKVKKILNNSLSNVEKNFLTKPKIFLKEKFDQKILLPQLNQLNFNTINNNDTYLENPLNNNNNTKKDKYFASFNLDIKLRNNLNEKNKIQEISKKNYDRKNSLIFYKNFFNKKNLNKNLVQKNNNNSLKNPKNFSYSDNFLYSIKKLLGNIISIAFKIIKFPFNILFKIFFRKKNKIKNFSDEIGYQYFRLGKGNNTEIFPLINEPPKKKGVSRFLNFLKNKIFPKKKISNKNYNQNNLLIINSQQKNLQNFKNFEEKKPNKFLSTVKLLNYSLSSFRILTNYKDIKNAQNFFASPKKLKRIYFLKNSLQYFIGKFSLEKKRSKKFYFIRWLFKRKKSFPFNINYIDNFFKFTKWIKSFFNGKKIEKKDLEKNSNNSYTRKFSIFTLNPFGFYFSLAYYIKRFFMKIFGFVLSLYLIVKGFKYYFKKFFYGNTEKDLKDALELVKEMKLQNEDILRNNKEFMEKLDEKGNNGNGIDV